MKTFLPVLLPMIGCVFTLSCKESPEDKAHAGGEHKHAKTKVLEAGADKSDAKLIGIEYIISAKLFQTLDPDEKKLWHSHVHEVKSGQLIAPRIPAAAEKELMKDLVGTYGKTWHTWQVDRGDKVPLGIPQLMMGFTKDGQANADLIKARDDGYGISSEKKRNDRSDIASPGIMPGADDWQNGEAIQLDAKTLPSK